VQLKIFVKLLRGGLGPVVLGFASQRSVRGGTARLHVSPEKIVGRRRGFLGERPKEGQIGWGDKKTEQNVPPKDFCHPDTDHQLLRSKPVKGGEGCQRRP